MTDEQRELVTRFMPMARMLAGRAGKQAAEHDEMVAEAYAALVDAARTFDPERGVYFAIHARPRIVGALRDFRRFLFHANWRGRTQESPVFERLETDGDVHGQVLGMEAQAAPGQEEELAEAVRAIIHRLPRSESIACRLIYLEGKTHGEIAEVLGCTKGYVSRLQSDALARIRRVHSEALAG